MRVVAIQEGGEPRLEIRPPIAPGAGELLLRMTASGLCGTDLFKLANGSAAAGAVLGHEIVGEVIALGGGVDRFRLGDRVVVPHHLACGRCRLCLAGAETQCAEFRTNLLAPGGFADEICVAAPAVARSARLVPAHVDPLDALFLEPAACVVRSVAHSRIENAAGSGPSGSPPLALVLGGGSMGQLHLLVLKALVADCSVTVVDPRADRRALALELGAEDAMAPEDPALATFGADAVFDCVGGASTSHTALAALRPGGTAVLFAHARPGETPGFDLNELFKHEKRLAGAYSGSLREQSRVFDLLLGGAFRPGVLVTHRLPLTEFAHGLDLARRQEALKVVFEPERG